LKHIGGSPPDDWNHLIATETVQALFVRDTAVRSTTGRSMRASAGSSAVAPRDETEGMKSEE
jgi:hypothetical protein